jgi:uncharacterized membrane protein YoaK (UPF0700 family)
VLSLVAGSVDAITFLGLGGPFTAHVTGNLIILAAHNINGGSAPLAPILAVPVFSAALGLKRLLASRLEVCALASLRPLLVLQLLLLACSFAFCAAAGPGIDPNAANRIIAGMLGVAATAVQMR